MTVDAVTVNVPPAVIVKAEPEPLMVKVSSEISKVSFAPMDSVVSLTSVEVVMVLDVPSTTTVPKSCPTSDIADEPVPSKVSVPPLVKVKPVSKVKAPATFMFFELCEKLPVSKWKSPSTFK